MTAVVGAARRGRLSGTILPRSGSDAGPAAAPVSATGFLPMAAWRRSSARLLAVLVFCAAARRRRHGGARRQRFARAYLSIAVVALLDATEQRLTSSTVVVGLVVPAGSCAVVDTGENPSLLGMASMEPMASFPS